MKAKLLIALFLTPVAAATASAGTLTVTNTNDNLAGSLRQAILNANTGDTITFAIPTTDPGYNPAARTWTIFLSSELAVNKDLTISGGNQHIVVERSGPLGAPPTLRIINVLTGNVIISNLTIANGSASDGAGIRNAANLTLRNCTFFNNIAGTGDGGAINNASGANLSVIECTFNGNAGFGTILNASGASLMVESSTLVLNGFSFPGVVGGIYNTNGGTAHIHNSIIAANSGSPLDVSGDFISDGYNFIGAVDGSAGFGASGSHDQTGTNTAPANPQVGLLQNNGGATPTMAPLPGSPIIDQGNSLGLATDQRGFRRPTDQSSIANAGDGSDIGAFELGLIQASPSFTVTTTDEHSDGLCEGQDCTLWDAANAADNNAQNNSLISFAPGVTGTITTVLQAQGINLLRPMTINGPGARLLTISGGNAGRVFNADSEGVIISGLTVADGNIADKGGGIFNAGNLTVQNCSIVNNTGTAGGGIFSSGTLTLSGCTLATNTSTGNGGGVQSTVGTVTITNCTFAGNQAVSGAGLSSGVNSSAVTTVRSSTFIDNMAIGPPSFARGGGMRLTNGTAEVTNTLIANNIAATSGPDLDLAGANLTADYNLIRDTDGWNPTVQGTHNITGQDPQLDPAGLKNNGGPTDTIALLGNSPAINAANDAVAPGKDQRGLARNGVSDIGAFEFGGLLPVSLGNISTRGMVGINDEVMIGGFVINGTANKTVLLRAVGPSLSRPPFNLNNTLQDPTLSLFSGGNRILFNDNWGDAANAQTIPAALQPQSGTESAILTSLAPGSYTAIVQGVNGGTGLGLVEVFDLDATVPSMLANISTRGLVETADGVLIGGFVVKGPDSDKVVIRAIGPSLANPPFNLTNVLQNPTLGLFNDQGQRIQFNDDWQTDQAAEIAATGLQPTNTAESAIVTTLMAGNYTAIVNGTNSTTGLALVEVFGLN